ncbi:MAG: superoxide dismutase family protein [Bacteroidota bacterium]
MIKKSTIGILMLIIFSSCQEETKIEIPYAEARVVVHPIRLNSTQDAESMFASYNVDYQDTLGVAFLKGYSNRVELQLNLNCDKPNTSSALHMHYGTPEKPKHHWNPEGAAGYCDVLSLGEVWGRKHAGDLGNIDFDESGDGTFFLETNLWSLNSGEKNDILGKIIVVHYLYEDFALQFNNNSHSHTHQNPKIGSGIIELIE